MTTNCAVNPDCEKMVKEIHAALVGTLEHPDGIVNTVKRHDRDLYGVDGKNGLRGSVAELKAENRIAKALGKGAWAVGAVVLYAIAEKWVAISH